jgi:hypothetical protein
MNRKIFGPKKCEVSEQLMILHTKQLHVSYRSSIVRIGKEVAVAQTCSLAFNETENAYTVLVEKPLRKRPLGSPRRKS